mmetsp:Transcript_3648/g.11266  ORF Transcript_3648/g.11266 Transcript_3648/m.11266 type:complete len:272 (-) Transcript_3648:2604-3419(-)
MEDVAASDSGSPLVGEAGGSSPTSESCCCEELERKKPGTVLRRSPKKSCLAKADVNCWIVALRAFWRSSEGVTPRLKKRIKKSSRSTPLPKTNLASSCLSTSKRQAERMSVNGKLMASRAPSPTSAWPRLPMNKSLMCSSMSQMVQRHTSTRSGKSWSMRRTAPTSPIRSVVSSPFAASCSIAVAGVAASYAPTTCFHSTSTSSSGPEASSDDETAASRSDDELAPVDERPFAAESRLPRLSRSAIQPLKPWPCVSGVSESSSSSWRRCSQ